VYEITLKCDFHHFFVFFSVYLSKRKTESFLENYQIQNFNPEIILNPNLNYEAFSVNEFKELELIVDY